MLTERSVPELEPVPVSNVLREGPDRSSLSPFASASSGYADATTHSSLYRAAGMWHTRTSGPVRAGACVREALLVLLLAAGASGGTCTGGEGEVIRLPPPPRDCVSAQKPEGGELCGLNIWDRDDDTISNETELNNANTTAYGGFYNFSTARWDTNYSQARGTATFGELYKGMNLRDFGTGYSHYDVCDGTDVDDWGTGHLVRLIEGAGRWWFRLRSTTAQMQVGDLSRRLGGEFPGNPAIAGCEQGHEYHRQGVDVDLRYVKVQGQEGPFDICRDSTLYDPAQTAVLINSFLAAEDADDANAFVDSIFVDLNCWRLGTTTTSGRRLIYDAVGHRNHFHVRIRDPDGPGN